MSAANNQFSSLASLLCRFICWGLSCDVRTYTYIR